MSSNDSPGSQRRRQEEFYAETQFNSANLKRSIHLGWGAAIGEQLAPRAKGAMRKCLVEPVACLCSSLHCTGTGIIMVCMAASAITQAQSWNVGARWLQRRTGAQFGTMAYVMTTNAMYYHDGDRWVTRDWARMDRLFS
jgi:hypothetical protein